jgi:hypothetical protein
MLLVPALSVVLLLVAAPSTQAQGEQFGWFPFEWNPTMSNCLIKDHHHSLVP